MTMKELRVCEISPSTFATLLLCLFIVVFVDFKSNKFIILNS